MAGLARTAIRLRYLVIACWAAAATLMVVLFPPLSSVVNTDNSSFLSRRTASTRVPRVAPERAEAAERGPRRDR